MIIKPFEQWREDRIAEAGRKACEFLLSGDEPDPQEYECPDCHGDGSRDCDCGCPNCYGAIDCQTCDGNGYIETTDPLLLESIEKEKADRKEYLRQLARELVLLSEWQGKPSLFHIVDAGMAPATIIQRDGAKVLVIHDPDTGSAVDAPEGVPRS